MLKKMSNTYLSPNMRNQSRKILKTQMSLVKNIESYDKINKDIINIIRRKLLLNDIKYCQKMAPSIGPINSEIASEFHKNLKKVSNYFEVMHIDIDQLHNTVERIKIDLKILNAARTI